MPRLATVLTLCVTVKPAMHQPSDSQRLADGKKNIHNWWIVHWYVNYPNWKSTTMILLSLNHIMMPIFHITYFVNYYIMLCYAMAFHSILNYLTCYQTLFIAVQCVTWYLFAYVVRCYVIIVLYLCRILGSCINPYLQFCYVVAICSILCDIVLYCDTLLYIYIYCCYVYFIA